jgi:hypothetical protein
MFRETEDTLSNNARAVCRELMKSTVDAGIWRKNEEFTAELMTIVQQHSIVSHPIVSALEGGQLDNGAIRRTHLEFRHAFAQIFTDALIQVMFTSAQLEARQNALGKAAARFLIQLNVFDELGFEPSNVAGETNGTPLNSHYVQFEKTLLDLGLTAADIRNYVPSKAARECRGTLENVFGDHCMLSLVLALAESVFTKFAGPWAQNVKKTTNVDTTVGYHAIHVEHEGEFVDDEHSEDMWFVFMQAADPDQYGRCRAKTKEVLDIWHGFLDHMMSVAA